MNDFTHDDEWQRDIRDRSLALNFYGNTALARGLDLDGPAVFLDRHQLALEIQQRYKFDTIIRSRRGPIFIEEKIVRWKGYDYTAIAVETKSCTLPGRETDGWIVTSRADYLLYCMLTMESDLHCHMWPMAKLRAFFLPRIEEFYEHVETERNRTASRIVPIATINNAGVPYRSFWCPTLRQGERAA